MLMVRTISSAPVGPIPQDHGSPSLHSGLHYSEGSHFWILKIKYPPWPQTSCSSFSPLLYTHRSLEFLSLNHTPSSLSDSAWLGFLLHPARPTVHTRWGQNSMTWLSSQCPQLRKSQIFGQLNSLLYLYLTWVNRCGWRKPTGSVYSRCHDVQGFNLVPRQSCSLT